MKNKLTAIFIIAAIGTMLFGGCVKQTETLSKDLTEPPVFTDAAVHDPSVIKVEDTYYVIGSHLQSAKTNDLMNWTQISSSPQKGNKLVPNSREEMREALKWAKTSTFWAGDIKQLSDGKFYMYYCNCKGDSPLSYLGLAVSDNIEGPYKNLGPILRSGMTDEMSEDGTPYDATVHPNAVDPHTFFDKEGKLWMVYGSYSGGIYILKVNLETGFPFEGQGYGKKLLGGNHSRIEAPYILYNKQTDYYYMFLSFGGLGSKDGYNIRVVRSKNPDGPYLDSEGQDMIDCKGADGSVFDDRAIEPYGVKLMGSHMFGSGAESIGYRSPGHNSAYYDEENDKYYVFFHTRFEGKGEKFQVRVHQMFFNEDGWPVIAPHRYAGESLRAYSKNELAGNYHLINHGKEISSELKRPVDVVLNKNGKITGAKEGTWKKVKDNQLTLTIDNEVYKGNFIRQWDEDSKAYVMSFTAVSEKGVSVWGSKDSENKK